MTIEQKIMSAVVRMDMFLEKYWIYVLALIIILGIGLLVNIRTRLK